MVSPLLPTFLFFYTFKQVYVYLLSKISWIRKWCQLLTLGHSSTLYNIFGANYIDLILKNHFQINSLIINK